ncbi:ExeA family protein [Pseudomonadota bacterium]
MYNAYFNFKEAPFSIAPDPRYLYMTGQHREALAHLVYGLNSEGGCILLTGEVGTGKTTVCRCLLEQIPEHTNIALVVNPKVTAIELLETICDELKIEYPAENNTIKTYIDLINHFLIEANARNEKTVLIIDEAQNLDDTVLEQLRLLTNLETNQRKLLQIIILGQPELLNILARQEMRQLAQRITARFHLNALSRNEVKAYINHRLAIAGQNARLFPDPTISQLYSLSKGIPRLLNVICDRALLGTYVQNKPAVDKKTLATAAKEVFGELKQVQNKSKLEKLIRISAVISISAIAAALIFILIKRSRNLQPVRTLTNLLNRKLSPQRKLHQQTQHCLMKSKIFRLSTNQHQHQNL